MTWCSETSDGLLYVARAGEKVVIEDLTTPMTTADDTADRDKSKNRGNGRGLDNHEVSHLGCYFEVMESTTSRG